MKINVRYYTEFGSDTTTMELEELPNFLKRFKIASITQHDDVYDKKDLEKAWDEGRLYEAGELELDTNNQPTAFGVWFKTFKK